MITIAGESKQAFAHALHDKSGGKVDLVIVQKRKRPSFLKRLRRLYNAVGWRKLPREFWYMALMRINRKTRQALECFREHTPVSFSSSLPFPKTLEVESVNSNEVYDALRRLTPELIVVWGTAVLKPHIIQTGQRVINLHLGHCPFYRGAVANQYAVLHRDYSKIGATIHYAEEKVDAGKILAVITPDISKPPRELFRDLNDRARERYLDIALRLYAGEEVPAEHQDISLGKNYLLKQWTNEVRYKLGRHMLEWETAHVVQPQDSIAGIRTDYPEFGYVKAEIEDKITENR